MTDPDAALLNYMAQFGLNPGTIKWDKKFHHFLSPGQTCSPKSGAAWYIAHPDPPQSAAFGDFKRNIEEKWSIKTNGKGDELDPEELARIQAEREAAQEAKWREGAKKAQERWEAATYPTPKHPYLLAKGITEVDLLRQEKSLLLVPMRGFDFTNSIQSLQEIQGDGSKKFMAGCKAKGTRMTIGADAFDGTLYICEGFATGYSIHQVTGAPVVVAFFSGNLKCVAEEVRQRKPEATIIIAADNDRWSETMRGPNPGLLAAKEAADAANALVAIPDFQDLSGKPTDFNDLLLREGMESVLQWLDPAVAHHATTLPGVEERPPPSPGPTSSEDEPIPEEPMERPAEVDPTVWVDTAKFRCLGYNRNRYFYLPEEKGQITVLTSVQHHKLNLMTMADLDWWAQTFPTKRDINWDLAVNALYRASHRAGVFTEDKVRGRGCWPEEDEKGDVGLVLHLGDRLLPPGKKKFMKPDQYRCPHGKFYERLGRLDGPSKKKAMTLEEAQQLLPLFQDLLWYEESSGFLAAGWTVLAPIAGILPWRPHIWITGGVGSGKTTVQGRLIQPLLGGMMHSFDGATTEAGIRQKMGSDALAVLYDEAEKTDKGTDRRIQAVLSLARGASSMTVQSETAKGTQHGTVLSFQVRSMFCLASVGGALKQEADKTRFSVLQLKAKANVEPGEKLEHWKGYEPRLNQVDVNMGRELIARTLGWARDGRLAKTLEVFRLAASEVLADPRFGDQYGTLYAGAWTLTSDEPPDPMEAKELMGVTDLTLYVEDQMPDGIRALNVILQSQERVDTSNGVRTLTVGQLVGIASGDMGKECTAEEANAKLKQLGLRVDLHDGAYFLFLANSSEWIKDTLKDTPYTNIQSVLRTLRDAINPKNSIRFSSYMTSRCWAVPLALLD